MKPLFFKVRDSLSGKWRQTRYRLNGEEARQRYGDGNYERLDWTRKIRNGDPDKQRTSHLLVPRAEFGHRTVALIGSLKLIYPCALRALRAVLNVL